MSDFSVIDLFLQASLIVQLVMILLLMVSIISWIVIFERHFNLSRIKQANKEFEKEFWSGKDLNELYMMFFPLFFFIAYFESKKDLFAERALDSLRNIKWHIFITLMLFIVYVTFRVMVGSSYGGRTLSFNFIGFIDRVYSFYWKLGGLWEIIGKHQG